MEIFQTYIGYAAGLLVVIPFYLLIVAIKRGNEKPNLAGFVLYAVALFMIVASSIALGAWQAVWLIMISAIGELLVIAVTFKTGYFAFSRFDYWCLALSFLGLLLWIYTGNPLYALILNVAVDAFGTLVIVRKLYLNPGTEDTKSWSFFFYTAVLNMFAVASFDISNALYPVYLVAANGLITGLSLRRPKIEASMDTNCWCVSGSCTCK